LVVTIAVLHGMLTIIIISYNSFEVLLRCQAALLQGKEFPILVIDNASSDGSADKLSCRFPAVEVLPLAQNLGYGRAANLGLGRVKTRYALLLNPDLIVQPDEIKRLLSAAISDDIRTVLWGPAVREKDLTGQSVVHVDKINGSAMLFDMERIQKVGLFDENIFLFFEETDLCYRIIQAGFRIGQCRDVFFRHLWQQSTPETPRIQYLKDWHYGWSYGYFLTKHRLDPKRQKIRRLYWRYRLRSWFSFCAKKRRQYRARKDGLFAFIQGGSAFDRCAL
jgi:GT2 family glycosyltransferase